MSNIVLFCEDHGVAFESTGVFEGIDGTFPSYAEVDYKDHADCDVSLAS